MCRSKGTHGTFRAGQVLGLSKKNVDGQETREETGRLGCRIRRALDGIRTWKQHWILPCRETEHRGFAVLERNAGFF